MGLESSKAATTNMKAISWMIFGTAKVNLSFKLIKGSSGIGARSSRTKGMGNAMNSH